MDIPRLLEFYRDLLGGRVTYQFPAEGEPGYVSLDIGGSRLGISGPDQPGELVNNRILLWLYAEDCDAAVQRLRAGGVRVVQEPADQPWGERTAAVLDPDGNRVMVATR
jgi:lactoylglutathione lyase